MVGDKDEIMLVHQGIADQYSDVDHYNDVMRAANIGKEIFTDNDLFVKHPLDRLLRYFFLRNKITWSYLKNTTFNWYRIGRIYDPVLSKLTNKKAANKQNSDWSNMQKIILGKKSIFGLTYRSLSFILGDILGWCVIDIEITLKHVSTKETFKMSLSGIEEHLKKTDSLKRGGMRE